MRTLHADTLAALKTDHHRAILIKLDFVANDGTPMPIYLNNTAVDISYNGNTYFGNGQFLTLDKIKQDIEIRVSTLNITLDAVDPSLVAVLLGTPQHGRNVDISLAILNNNYAIAGTPIAMHSMIIDGSPSITDDPSKGKAIIKQKISSEFANWKQKASLRTTPASLQRFAPNDTGFDFASESGKKYPWGRK